MEHVAGSLETNVQQQVTYTTTSSMVQKGHLQCTRNGLRSSAPAGLKRCYKQAGQQDKAGRPAGKLPRQAGKAGKAHVPTLVGGVLCGQGRAARRGCHGTAVRAGGLALAADLPHLVTHTSANKTMRPALSQTATRQIDSRVAASEPAWDAREDQGASQEPWRASGVV
jgi:hypothetical protein